MKLKILFVLVLAMCLNVNIQAQELYISVDKKGKVGFVDKSGNLVIKNIYDTAMPFRNGFSIVSKGGKTGIIDETGKNLLPLKYSQITDWTNNLLLVKSDKLMGLVDYSGKIVLPVKYTHISKINSYGKALITLGGKATTAEKKTYMANAKYGIIDNNGQIIISPIYKGLYEFSYEGKNKLPYYEGMRLEYSYHFITDTLKTNCEFLGYSSNGNSIYNAGILDQTGKEVLKSGLYTFCMLPKSNMVRYYKESKKETICGYYDLNTGKSFEAAKFKNSINDMNYWSHGDFIENIAPVNGESWSIIDRNGNMLRTGYQSLIHSEQTKLWAAKNAANKWDVFSDKNEDIKSLSGFEEIRFISNPEDKELFTVKKDSQYGCITRDGVIVVPFEYDKILTNQFGVIPVMKDQKWGALSENNNTIIPLDYSNLILPIARNTDHFWVMKSDSLFYHYNAITKNTSSEGYKNVFNFSNSIACVTPSNIEIENNQINKAQLFKENTEQSIIDNANVQDSKDAFFIIIDTNDNVIFDLPVSAYYLEYVKDAIAKNNYRKLTKSEERCILLEATLSNRSYNIKSKLTEDDWNY